MHRRVWMEMEEKLWCGVISPIQNRYPRWLEVCWQEVGVKEEMVVQLRRLVLSWMLQE